MEEEEEEGKMEEGKSLQEDELSSQRLLMRTPPQNMSMADPTRPDPTQKMSTADLARPDPTQPKKGEEDADA